MQLEKLNDQVWVLHNFVPRSELNSLVSDLRNHSEEAWNLENVEKNSFWYGRNFQIKNLSNDSMEFIKYVEKALGTVFADYDRIHEIQSILRTLPDGRALGDHKDNAAEDDKSNMFGVVLYLNEDYEGGEIYYKDLDLSYKPKSGDLVVHYAGLTHGVHQVSKGIRYVVTSFVKGSSKTTFMGDTSGG